MRIAQTAGFQPYSPTLCLNWTDFMASLGAPCDMVTTDVFQPAKYGGIAVNCASAQYGAPVCTRCPLRLTRKAMACPSPSGCTYVPQSCPDCRAENRPPQNRPPQWVARSEVATPPVWIKPKAAITGGVTGARDAFIPCACHCPPIQRQTSPHIFPEHRKKRPNYSPAF